MEIIPRLRGLFVDVGIVALTGLNDGDLEEGVRTAGADRTVVRTRVSSDLMPAVREAAGLARTRQRMADQSALDQTP